MLKITHRYRMRVACACAQNTFIYMHVKCVRSCVTHVPFAYETLTLYLVFMGTVFKFRYLRVLGPNNGMHTLECKYVSIITIISLGKLHKIRTCSFQLVHSDVDSISDCLDTVHHLQQSSAINCMQYVWQLLS